MQNPEFVYVVYNFYKDKIKDILIVPHASYVFCMREKAMEKANEPGDLVIWLEWIENNELANEEVVKTHVKNAIIAKLNGKHYMCNKAEKQTMSKAEEMAEWHDKKYVDDTILDVTNAFPEPNLCKILGVKVNQKFKFEDGTLKVKEDGFLYFCIKNNEIKAGHEVWADLINNTKTITPIAQYTDKEVRMAKLLLEYGVPDKIGRSSHLTAAKFFLTDTGSDVINLKEIAES